MNGKNSGASPATATRAMGGLASPVVADEWYREPSFLVALAVSVGLHVALVAWGPRPPAPPAAKPDVLEVRFVASTPPPPPEKVPEPPPEVPDQANKVAASAPQVSKRTELNRTEASPRPPDRSRPRAKAPATTVKASRREKPRSLPPSSTRGIDVPALADDVLPRVPDASPAVPVAGPKPETTRAARPEAGVDLPRISAPDVVAQTPAAPLRTATAEVPRVEPRATPDPATASARPEVRAGEPTPGPAVAVPSQAGVPVSARSEAAEAPPRPRAVGPELTRPQVAVAVPVVRATGEIEDDAVPRTSGPVRPVGPAVRPLTPKPDPQPSARVAPRAEVGAAPSADLRAIAPRDDVAPRPELGDTARPAVPAPAAAVVAPGRPSVVAAEPELAATAPPLERAEVPRIVTGPAAKPRPEAPERPSLPVDAPPVVATPAAIASAAPAVRPAGAPHVAPEKPVEPRPAAQPKPGVSAAPRPVVAAAPAAVSALPETIAVEKTAPPSVETRPPPGSPPRAGRPVVRVARPSLIAETAPDLPAAGVAVPDPRGVPGVGGTGTDSSPQVAGPQAGVVPATRPSVAPVPGSPTIDRGALQSYGLRLSRAIGRDKMYPRKAQHLGQEGTVLVRVIITRGGRIKEATVVKSSGFELLDEEALAKFKRAGSLPAPPPGTSSSEISVTIPIEFRLE